MICFGGNITAPDLGYWRSNATGNVTLCHRQENCLPGNETEPFGICADGYGGILCNNCLAGWFRSGKSTCSECPILFFNILIFAAIIIALIGIIVVLVRSTLGGVALKKPLYSVYQKQFMNHFQLIAAVSSINFKWPTEISTILSAQ
jgi:hypothetical protein